MPGIEEGGGTCRVAWSEEMTDEGKVSVEVFLGLQTCTHCKFPRSPESLNDTEVVEGHGRE